MDEKLLGKSTSIWLDTTPSTDFPELSEDIETDVAIIGGGIAGLSAAYFLKKAGKKVIVLESERIVNGTTGYTTAKITSAHGLIYNYLIGKFGHDKARMYAEANQMALEKMVSVMTDLQIDADLKRLPAYTYALPEGDIEAIKKEVDAARELGLPVSFTTDLPLPFAVGGAIQYENQACYHPRKYLLGLANKIDGGGSFIFENTRVLNIEEGEISKVVTTKGKVSAKDIIVATNYPIYDPLDYFAQLLARQSLAIAITLKDTVPQGVFYSTEKSFHSLRPLPHPKGEMFLVGNELFKSGDTSNIDRGYENLAKWAKEHFDMKSVEYHWTTSDSESEDRVPLIGRVKPHSKHLFVATGFSGWGMTHGTVAGMLVSDLILENENHWQNLYDPTRLYKPQNIIKNFLASVLGNRGAKLSQEPEKIELQNGEAKVIEKNGKKVAVYKDENGEVHAISAKCTHMGCTIGWNSAEKTWDCPCHGSRYNIEGVVIHGPAPKNLEHIELG